MCGARPTFPTEIGISPSPNSLSSWRRRIGPESTTLEYIYLWVSLTDSESKHVASDTERASVVCPHTLPSPPSQIMTPPPPHIAILRRHPPSPHTRTNISQNSIHPSQPIHLPQITLILMNWYDTHTQIPIISAHLCSGTISSTEMKISGKNSVRR